MVVFDFFDLLGGGGGRGEGDGSRETESSRGREVWVRVRKWEKRGNRGGIEWV